VTAGGWTRLLEEPLRKVLEELLSRVHLRTEGVGASLGDGTAGVHWVDVSP
jgi:hypothetical protein